MQAILIRHKSVRVFLTAASLNPPLLESKQMWHFYKLWRHWRRRGWCSWEWDRASSTLIASLDRTLQPLPRASIPQLICSLVIASPRVMIRVKNITLPLSTAECNSRFRSKMSSTHMAVAILASQERANIHPRRLVPVCQRIIQVIQVIHE